MSRNDNYTKNMEVLDEMSNVLYRVQAVLSGEASTCPSSEEFGNQEQANTKEAEGRVFLESLMDADDRHIVARVEAMYARHNELRLSEKNLAELTMVYIATKILLTTKIKSFSNATLPNPLLGKESLLIVNLRRMDIGSTGRDISNILCRDDFYCLPERDI
ncbi:MAG: hypothetical protein MMC33_001236 [Icmadophila ericetorum]|nr:hypothetical protein [Icmadophila ericetorum]